MTKQHPFHFVTDLRDGLGNRLVLAGDTHHACPL